MYLCSMNDENVIKVSMRLHNIFTTGFFVVVFFLFAFISCIKRTDNHSLVSMPRYGFQVMLPGNVYSGSDTTLYGNNLIVNYVWKSVERTADNRNIFYNVATTTYPSHVIHSDSVGMVQVLFSDKEPAYFLNSQYELIERNDISRFGYPGTHFIWLNKEDNSRICNYYYMVENKLYYLSIVLPGWNDEMIALRDQFINSFDLIKEQV